MRSTRRVWWRGVVLATAPLLVLTACMSDGDDSSAGTDGAEEAESVDPVTLRMSVWTSNEDQLALLDDIAEAYAAQEPSVDGVEFESRAPDEYTTALTTQLAGGNAPDLGWVFEQDAKQFIASGALVDVGPDLRADEEYGLDDFVESALDLWVDGDGVYAYPFSTSPFGIFYNADHFESAGASTPDELIADGDWTWERLAEVAAEVVDSGEARGGFGFQRFDYQEWASLAIIWRAFGANAWSADGTQCQLADPEMVDAMTFFHDMVFEAGAHPGPGTSADFFAGESAMIAAQIGRASLLADVDYEWGLVPLPSGPAGDAAVIGQAGMGVFSASDNHEAATGFLKFLTNAENGARLAQFWPPPRTSLLSAELLAETNPLLSEEQLEQVVVAGIQNGEVLPSHPNQAQLSDTVRAELDALWRADADPTEVLAQTCEAAAPLLASS
jgi:multiple sugar transport system substrate-binding protein